MVEQLIDKPDSRTVRQWLDDIKTTVNANQRVSEEWISFAGEPALKVITRNADATQSEVVYVVHGLSTFEISFVRNLSSSVVCREMLVSFRFTAPASGH